MQTGACTHRHRNRDKKTQRHKDRKASARTYHTHTCTGRFANRKMKSGFRDKGPKAGEGCRHREWAYAKGMWILTAQESLHRTSFCLRKDERAGGQHRCVRASERNRSEMERKRGEKEVCKTEASGRRERRGKGRKEMIGRERVEEEKEEGGLGNERQEGGKQKW